MRGKIILLAVMGIVWGNGSRAQVSREDYRRIDTLSRRGDLVYDGAVYPEWIGKSHYFWYWNHGKEGDSFWLVNVENGKKQEAFPASKLATLLAARTGEKVEAGKLPFRKIEFREDRKGFSFTFRDKVWEYDIRQNRLAEKGTSGRNSEKGENNGGESAKTAVSPDGQWEAFSRGGNIYVRHKAENKDYPLSYDGTKDFYYTSDIRWSPDSRKLAVIKVKEKEERRIPLIESSPESQKQPILQWRDYAKPGDVLPIYLPALFDVTEKRQIHLETELYENQFYLYLTGWRADSRAFTFEFNQRGHQRYIVAEVDATDGSIRPIVDEQSPTFIHYGRNFRYDLKDGKEMLWISERDGWRHLYLIDGESGRIGNRVTRGEWVVRDIVYVDEAERTVLFTASGLHAGEDPYHLHYCRIGFDGTGFKDLTPEPAHHRAVFSADRRYFTDVYSRPDLPPVSVVRDGKNGAVIAELQRADIRELSERGWRLPEVFTAKGRDGKTDIWGNIYRPSNFKTDRSYPVVEMIYAGPHDSHVDKDFRVYHHLLSRLCELGFIVVTIDGMGTANRSKAFHDVCWKNLKDAGFPDRIAWIKAAATRYPYMDTARVGIYGWSAGGQNAMAALLFHSGFYKAAVALCGCHDNRMDKIWWNEQWMGYPVDESYAASSNVDNAWRLKGKLLLVNGELDDNVDPASTLQVVDALVKAGKNFEQLYLPNHTHSLGGDFEMHRIHDFFVKHLLHQDPPEWE